MADTRWANNIASCKSCKVSQRARGSAGLFQRREGSWRQDLVANACDDGSIAFPLVAHLVPSRVGQERRPPRLEIGQRLPLEHVSQLVAGFPDEGRPKADGTDAVLFPDGRKLVSKSSLQLCHLARNGLIHTQLVNHRGSPL